MLCPPPNRHGNNEPGNSPATPFAKGGLKVSIGGELTDSLKSPHPLDVNGEHHAVFWGHPFLGCAIIPFPAPQLPLPQARQAGRGKGGCADYPSFTVDSFS